MIAPLPAHVGYGLSSDEPLDLKGFRYEQVGRYHNYYFTTEEWEWPSHLMPKPIIGLTIDGFSPNLNKQLHIGHLRNLAVGASLTKITNAEPVAMLGASLGTIPNSRENLQRWYALAKYNPEVYLDTELKDVLKGWDEGEGDYEGCLVYKGPKGPVVVKRSDGTSTYALHDLLFAKKAKPTHYVTDIGQKVHFESLGLGDKFLPMGLVLGEDGKKLKSRTGDAFSADEALQLVVDSLGRGVADAADQSDTTDQSEDSKQLAWNILSWNFLSVSRSQNVKFLPKEWANPDTGGLYISYTYARVGSALKKAGVKLPFAFEPHPKYEEIDIPLMGKVAYSDYYVSRARQTMDSAPIANYALDLAKVMNSTMSKQRIVDGTSSYKAAMQRAHRALLWCMIWLNMYPLEEV